MKISPGVKGREKYAIFYACALHLNIEPDKRRLKATDDFKKKTDKLLKRFLACHEYEIDEIEQFFDV